MQNLTCTRVLVSIIAPHRIPWIFVIWAFGVHLDNLGTWRGAHYCCNLALRQKLRP